MNVRVGRLVVCAWWALALVACAQAAVATPEPETIIIAGATAMHPVLNDLTAEFSRQHPNILFSVRGGGSTVGEEQVRSGRIQLAASSLLPPPPGPGGLPAPPQVRSGLVRVPVAIDGLAIIVHAGNDVPGVTLETLRELYRGRLLDWQEVGGAPGEVVLVSREDGSGSRRLFEETVMGDQPVSLTAVVMPTSEDMVEYISKTPQAIGYVSRAYIAGQLAAEPPASSFIAVKAILLNGMLPTDETLRSQTYPLIQPLYLISRGEPAGWIRQFIDFVLSPRGQAIVARYHLRVR
jgi:phosphate transport system substrate-binding protein